jgi:outer membrane receptor protein involved in Fe transport
MMRDCVRPSLWGTASKGFFCATVFGLGMQLGPVLAQSGQSLPPVTVDAPKPQAARPTQPARRAARSQSSARRATAPAQQQPPQTVDSVGRGAIGERGIGPVDGYLATQSVTATKTDTPILTTPQSISVVTQDQIQDQGAQNVTEALRYTPGVTIQSFGANAFFDSFKLRGFDAPRYLDGLRLPADNTTFAIPRIETYGLERLEVLKGPSAALYGQSEPGGLINMISKRPTSTPQYEVVGTFGSFDRFQGAFDIGGPIDKKGEIPLPHRRPCARQQQPDRLRPGQQAVHRTEFHLASDDGYQLHDSLAVPEGGEQGLPAICPRTGVFPAQSQRTYPLQPLYRRARAGRLQSGTVCNRLRVRAQV